MGMILPATPSIAAEIRHFRLDLVKGGTVRIDVPVVNRALVRVNGEIALDMRDRTNPSYRPQATILSVLPKGVHVVSVEGAAQNPNPRTAVMVLLPGEDAARPLRDLPQVDALKSGQLIEEGRQNSMPAPANPKPNQVDPAPRKSFTLGVSSGQ